LRRVKLDGANLLHAQLQDAKLNRATLNGANLAEAKLQGADLSDADLSMHDADGVRRRTVLAKADLRGAILRRAKLSGADLSEADLRGADLSNANLEGAILQRARLQGTTLFGAVVNKADMKADQLEHADGWPPGAEMQAQSKAYQAKNDLLAGLACEDPYVARGLSSQATMRREDKPDVPLRPSLAQKLFEKLADTRCHGLGLLPANAKRALEGEEKKTLAAKR
jgi:Pentapeptide repeats (8 copies)